MSLLEEYLPDVIPKAFVVTLGRFKPLELHQLQLCGERCVDDPGETTYCYELDDVEDYYFQHRELIFDELEAWKRILPQLERERNKAYDQVTRCDGAYNKAKSKIAALTPRNIDWSYK